MYERCLLSSARLGTRLPRALHLLGWFASECTPGPAPARMLSAADPTSPPEACPKCQACPDPHPPAPPPCPSSPPSAPAPAPPPAPKCPLDEQQILQLAGAYRNYYSGYVAPVPRGGIRDAFKGYTLWTNDFRACRHTHIRCSDIGFTLRAFVICRHGPYILPARALA